MQQWNWLTHKKSRLIRCWWSLRWIILCTFTSCSSTVFPPCRGFQPLSRTLPSHWNDVRWTGSSAQRVLSPKRLAWRRQLVCTHSPTMFGHMHLSSTQCMLLLTWKQRNTFNDVMMTSAHVRRTRLPWPNKASITKPASLLRGSLLSTRVVRLPISSRPRPKPRWSRTAYGASGTGIRLKSLPLLPSRHLNRRSPSASPRTRSLRKRPPLRRARTHTLYNRQEIASVHPS